MKNHRGHSPPSELSACYTHKACRSQKNAEVEVWGLIGGGACQAAYFETFVKDTESMWCMGVKQFEAWRICGSFFFQTQIYADLRRFEFVRGVG